VARDGIAPLIKRFLVLCFALSIPMVYKLQNIEAQQKKINISLVDHQDILLSCLDLTLWSVSNVA
jgi:hypothetical protein